MIRLLALYTLTFVFVMCGARPYDGLDADTTDFVTVSILHIGPGEDIYSACGHAALRMQCPTHDLDMSFGYLVPDSPMLVANTLYGLPKEGLARIPTSEYLSEIFNEGRSVDQYELNLTDTEKKRLWQYLDQESERGDYIDYDYINHGCALSLVSIVKEALIDETLGISTKQDISSCRTLVSRHLSDKPWTAFWMSFMLGEKTASKRDTDCLLMIPSDLINTLQTNAIISPDGQSRPILIGHEVLSDAHTMHHAAVTPLILALVIFCCCIVVLIVKSYGTSTGIKWWCIKIFDMLMLVILTGLGLLIASIIIFSCLYGTEFNWLILPYNVLPLCGYVFQRKCVVLAKIIFVVYILGAVSFLFITQSYVVEQAQMFLPSWVMTITAVLWASSFLTYKPDSLTLASVGLQPSNIQSSKNL